MMRLTITLSAAVTALAGGLAAFPQQAAAQNKVAEIIDGTLYLSPRPPFGAARAKQNLLLQLWRPYERGEAGAGRWWLLREPEFYMGTDVLVPDPLRQQLDLSLQSGLSYELRGVRALEARDFTAAAGFFKQGVDITPGTTPLGRSLRHKLATLGLALASLVASFALLPVLGTEFVPKADFGETNISFYTPTGSSLEVTEAKARQVDAILREFPEVRYTLTTINTGAAQGRNYASMYVRLVDRKERTRSVDLEASTPLGALADGNRLDAFDLFQYVMNHEPLVAAHR